MIKVIHWLGRNKLIAALLSVAVYFCIVNFHDEITLLAIRLRDAIGRDKYNEYLAYGFQVLLLVYIFVLFYHSYRSRQKYLKFALSIIIIALTVLAFRFLMIYNIEAIHFVEYMLVALLLLPILRSYGETVFWVTILGILDELFQYHFLTPDFEYFDFNDSFLNLIGAGAGVVMVFVLGGNTIELRQEKCYKSPAFLTGLGLLTIFFILLLSHKISIDPVVTQGSATWFSLNRESLPDEFWTTAYPGRIFHILRPFEGIIMIVSLLAGFFMLDVVARKTAGK